MKDYTTDELEAEIKRRKAIEYSGGCTGVSATWCPVCGDCVCPDPVSAMDDPTCPLHSPTSPHAEAELGF